MKGRWTVLPLLAVLVSGLFLVLLLGAVGADEEEIDWNRARSLMQKSQRGEALSPEEQTYLDRAREERRKRFAQGPPGKEQVGLTPVTEMGEGTHKGEDGGLYGDGRNAPPPAHREAALKEATQIVPRDADGKPSPEGKVVLVSIGMSNTSQEFSEFKQVADSDPQKSAALVIVNGAQGGQDASRWAAPEPGSRGGRRDVWAVLDQRLRSTGVTAQQVQVVWIKQALARPDRFGAFPDHARKMQADLVTALNRLKKRFPNLRIAYLSSRIYAGYARSALNPEPYAYEGAFTVRWLIQAQIKGDADLNYDPERGEVTAPLLLWGPYLWGDGVTPRKHDGVVWEREDLADDGTHPSMSGRRKVASLLLSFFKTDPSARPWFLNRSTAGDARPTRGAVQPPGAGTGRSRQEE